MTAAKLSGEERFTFSKKNRLCHKNSIKELFNNSSSFYLYPFVVKSSTALQHKGASHFQVLVTVPKRTFGRAVDRNMIRRRIKEVTRLHQQVITSRPDLQNLKVVLIYTAKDIQSFDLIQNKLILVFKRLANI